MAAAIAEVPRDHTLQLNVARSSASGMVRLDQRRTRGWGSSAKTAFVEDHSSAQSPNLDDPLRILAPAQKKLTTIESQRVISVVDETMKRLEGVILLPTLMESLERFSVPLGSELVTLLEEYRRLVDEYNRLEASLESQGIEPKVEGSMVNIEGSSLRLLEAAYSSSNVLKPNVPVSGSASAAAFGGERSPAPAGSASSLFSETNLSAKPRRLEPIVDSQLELTESAMEEKFLELRVQLRHVVRCLLRALSKNPSTNSVLQTLVAERSKTNTKLMTTVT